MVKGQGQPFDIAALANLVVGLVGPILGKETKPCVETVLNLFNNLQQSPQEHISDEYTAEKLKTFTSELEKVRAEIDGLFDTEKLVLDKMKNIQDALQKQKYEYAVECRAYLKMHPENVGCIAYDSQVETNLAEFISLAHKCHFIHLAAKVAGTSASSMIFDFEKKIADTPLWKSYVKCQLYNPEEFTIYSHSF
jgi:hypothetical protein